MTIEKTYEDEYGYRVKGSEYFHFNEKCKNCGTEMDEMHEDGRNTYGTTYTYWCPKCGTILHNWYDKYNIQDDDWMSPANVQ
jgi:formamidopyrimidine-DNA glycosylase